MSWYVYFHINPLKNEVFYVGIGLKPSRACTKHSRSLLWHNVNGKYGRAIDIVHEELTKEEAIEWEKFYIKRIGRRDQGKGPLVNHTDGGEGTVGHVHTPEGKAKMSLRGKGRKRAPFSEDHCRRLSEAAKLRKIYLHTPESKAKIAAALRGLPKSDAHRKALSESKKKRDA